MLELAIKFELDWKWKMSEMKPLSRRKFCSMTAALGAAALSAPRSLMAEGKPLEISLEIDAKTSLGKVPEDYMGLSYESG